MPTRPVQGGSNGTWGTELNAWLDVSMNSDGSLKGSTSAFTLSGAGSAAALTVADTTISAGVARSTFLGTMFNPPLSGLTQTAHITGTGRGNIGVTGTGMNGLNLLMQDHVSVVNKTITNCANNGSGLIRVTCTGHTFSTGDVIIVYGVVGTTEANGGWTITVIDANTFDLQSSAFVHAYTSGGTASNRPYMIGINVSVAPAVGRGGLTGGLANSDDIGGVTVQNTSGVSSAKATDAYYVAASPAMGANPAWFSAMSVDARCDNGIKINAPMTNYGIDLSAGTYGNAPVRLPNNTSIVARDSTNSFDLALIFMDTNNRAAHAQEIAANAGIYMPNTNLHLETVTGTQIGTATNQKLAFFAATPVVQPNTTGNTHTVAAGATTTVFTNTTFDGSTGTTAYTVGDIVKALKSLGLLAA